jgi:hypothetical protein
MKHSITLPGLAHTVAAHDSQAKAVVPNEIPARPLFTNLSTNH